MQADARISEHRHRRATGGVYAVVSDVPRLEPAVGAEFTGYNRLGDFDWSTRCEITEADPGRLFAYEVVRPGVRYSRWTYAFEPAGTGTRGERVVRGHEVAVGPEGLQFRAVGPARARADARRRDAPDLGRTETGRRAS